MQSHKIKIFIFLLFLGAFYLIFHIQLLQLEERLLKLEKSSNEVARNVQPNSLRGTDIVVFYNRVPKTGSTSFVGVAYDLCKKSQYHVLHVNVTGNGHVLSISNQIKFVQNVTEWQIMKPALYHGHFAFVDFAKFGAPKPLYINIIRKPLDRFVSYYYFLRYGDNFRPYLVRKKAGNKMTFDECVERSLPECDPTAMWLQVPFFCGHAANCWSHYKRPRSSVTSI